MEKISVSKIQEPLHAQYKTSTETARVIDRALTKGADASDPFHSVGSPSYARIRGDLIRGRP